MDAQDDESGHKLPKWTDERMSTWFDKDEFVKRYPNWRHIVDELGPGTDVQQQMINDGEDPFEQEALRQLVSKAMAVHYHRTALPMSPGDFQQALKDMQKDFCALVKTPATAGCIGEQRLEHLLVPPGARKYLRFAAERVHEVKGLNYPLHRTEYQVLSSNWQTMVADLDLQRTYHIQFIRALDACGIWDAKQEEPQALGLDLLDSIVESCNIVSRTQILKRLESVEGVGWIPPQINRLICEYCTYPSLLRLLESAQLLDTFLTLVNSMDKNLRLLITQHLCGKCSMPPMSHLTRSDLDIPFTKSVRDTLSSLDFPVPLHVLGVRHGRFSVGCLLGALEGKDKDNSSSPPVFVRLRDATHGRVSTSITDNTRVFLMPDATFASYQGGFGCMSKDWTFLVVPYGFNPTRPMDLLGRFNPQQVVEDEKLGLHYATARVYSAYFQDRNQWPVRPTHVFDDHYAGAINTVMFPGPSERSFGETLFSIHFKDGGAFSMWGQLNDFNQLFQNLRIYSGQQLW